MITLPASHNLPPAPAPATPPDNSKVPHGDKDGSAILSRLQAARKQISVDPRIGEFTRRLGNALTVNAIHRHPDGKDDYKRNKSYGSDSDDTANQRKPTAWRSEPPVEAYVQGPSVTVKSTRDGTYSQTQEQKDEGKWTHTPAGATPGPPPLPERNYGMKRDGNSCRPSKDGKDSCAIM